jgi:hypothetical protein
MPTLDTTAKTAIATNFAVAWFIYLDVVGDPLRVTNFGQNVAFSGTGDSDLDGNTFLSFAGQFLDIGEVNNSDNGSDTLTVTLSGIRSLDVTLMDAIGNVANWQGRTCRIWFQLYDESGTAAQGAIVSYYTGYMNSVAFIPGQEGQTIQLNVENYLAISNAPSNRNYMNQSDYDAGDTSAAATLAAANAARHSNVQNTTTTPEVGGGPGSGYASYTGSAGSGMNDTGGRVHIQ